MVKRSSGPRVSRSRPFPCLSWWLRSVRDTASRLMHVQLQLKSARLMTVQLRSDPERVRVILDNLLSNAAKHAPDGQYGGTVSPASRLSNW